MRAASLALTALLVGACAAPPGQWGLDQHEPAPRVQPADTHAVPAVAVSGRLVSPAPQVVQETFQLRLDAEDVDQPWPAPAAGPPVVQPPIPLSPAHPDEAGPFDAWEAGLPGDARLVEPAAGHPPSAVRISIARERGPPGEALSQVVWVTDRSDDLRAASQAAAHALLQGEPAQALVIYREILALLPGERSTLLGVATALRQLDRNAEAERLYRQLLEKNPYDRPVEVAYWGLRGERDPDEALAQLGRLAWQEPGDDRAQAQIGLILARQGHLVRAIAALQAALRLDPGNARYRADLITLGQAVARAQSGSRAAPPRAD